MEDIHNKFIQSWHTGVPVKELCKQFNICKSTAYNWLKKYSPVKRTKERTISVHRIYQLERENQTLRAENEIFRRSKCSVISPIDDKIAAIERLKDDFSVHMICKTLGILKSTYYHRVLRSPEKTQNEIIDEDLCPLIKEIFENSRERLGAPKIHFILKQQGYHISRAHVSRLMQEMGLVCKQLQLRHFSTTSRKYKVYHNRIQQKFMTEAPNMIWVSDITYVHVEDILCAIGVIIDLYARKVIAFDVAKTADSAFIQRMFDSAFEMRGKPVGLIFHSDQGSQYTAFEFRKHLRELGVKSSFSNPGTPLDNAVAESFFASMKREELSHKYYYDLEVLRYDVTDYIDFFNNMRPHQKLGMLTPSAAEAKFSE